MNEQQRTQRANDTVRKHMYGACAIGLLPVPWLDMAALSALQLNMLRSLAGQYGVSFSEDIGKSLIASVCGGAGAVSVSANVSSLFKTVPLFGVITGVSSAAFSGASTYAIGKIFIQHFESGGTFLNFDAEKARANYQKECANGQTELAKKPASYRGIKP